jgi:hypothetical protein
MRARIPLVLACAALLAVACQETPTEPVDPPVATAPEFNWMNGPPEAGVVVRSDRETYTIDLFWETPADPWILWMGLEPGQVPSWCAGDPERRANAEVQTIGARRGETIIELFKKDKVPVTVFDLQEHVDYFYEGLGLGEDPYCYAVTRASPVGGGMGTGRYTEKTVGDVFEFMYHFNGTVDYMGETYRLQWKYKSSGTGEGTYIARVH